MNLQTFQPGIYKRMQKKEQAIRSEFCHDRKESKPTYNIKKWTLAKGSLNLAEPLFCLQLSQAKSWAFMQCQIFFHGWCKTLFHFYIKCNALIPSSPPRRNYWGCYKINTCTHYMIFDRAITHRIFQLSSLSKRQDSINSGIFNCKFRF